MNNLQAQISARANQGFNKLVNTALGLTAQTMPSLSTLSIKEIEECLTEKVERICTGIDSIDDLFLEYRNGTTEFGFRQKDIVVLAGMSGIGKTTLSFTIFANLYQQNKSPIFFSLDMRKDQTWAMFKNAYMGFVATTEQFMYKMHTEPKPLIFTHNGDLPVQSIKNTLLANPNTNVIFIDYIDYLIPTKSNAKPMINFKNLMDELKQIANDCNCAIVLLSQSTEDKMYNAGRPSLSNLYGGKAVRSAVDHVLAVYRNSKHNKDLSQEFKYVTEVIGLKLRGNSPNTKAYINFSNGKMQDMTDEQVFCYINSQNK